MNKGKKLGIGMDHANAHLIEFNDLLDNVISSKFTHEEKIKSIKKSESSMHSKEQQLQSDYYKKIAEVIINYNEVVLFGPTDAKTELFNLLKADHLFSKINIETVQTDKMTEIQQHEFVKEYFANR